MRRSSRLRPVVAAAVVGVVLAGGAACQPSDPSSAAERVETARDRAAAAPDPTRATASGTATPESTPDPTEPVGDTSALLPNLRSLPAEKVRIRVTSRGRELRFASVLANVGVGPLVAVPDGLPGCPARQVHASQLIYLDANGNGSFERERDRAREVVPGGCMLDHPTHKHWHFDAMARYALTLPGSVEPIASQDKVSYCLRDSRRLMGTRWVDEPRTYRRCSHTTRQGISRGWADVYRSTLPGQELALSDSLPNGVYCLRNWADPKELLREMNEADNASAIAVRITGNLVSALSRDVCG